VEWFSHWNITESDDAWTRVDSFCCLSHCPCVCQSTSQVFVSASLLFLPICLSVSLLVSMWETQLSHIILWHSNFPLHCYWKKNTQVAEKRRTTVTLTQRRGLKGKTRRWYAEWHHSSLHIHSLYSLSFWYLCLLLSSCLVLSLFSVVYLEFKPTPLCITVSCCTPLCCATLALVILYYTGHMIKIKLPNNNNPN